MYLQTGDGCCFKQSSTSLLATGPCDPHICGKWPLNVRDSGFSVFCVWDDSACDLADHWDCSQAGDVEASGFVLVCSLWFHPFCPWGLVFTISWYSTRRPELPVPAVWVLITWWENCITCEDHFESICFFSFSGKEYSKGDSRYVMWVCFLLLQRQTWTKLLLCYMTVFLF